VFDVKFAIYGEEPRSWDKVWRGNPLTEKINLDYSVNLPGDRDTPEPALVSASEIVSHDEDYEDSRWKSVTLSPNEIKRVDSVTGEFIYATDDGIVVKLSRQKQQNYNWLAF
jgi:hypothetical protein